MADRQDDGDDQTLYSEASENLIQLASNDPFRSPTPEPDIYSNYGPSQTLLDRLDAMQISPPRYINAVLAAGSLVPPERRPARPYGSPSEVVQRAMRLEDDWVQLRKDSGKMAAFKNTAICSKGHESREGEGRETGAHYGRDQFSGCVLPNDS